MIERMKAVYVVTTEAYKDKMISELKNLGVLHIAKRKEANSEYVARLSELSKTLSELSEYSYKGIEYRNLLSDSKFDKIHQEIKQSLERKGQIKQEKLSIHMQIDRIEKWGDFDPDELKELKDLGFSFRLFTIGKKELAKLKENPDIKFIELKQIGKQRCIAVLNFDEKLPYTEFVIPELSLSKYKEKLEDLDLEDGKNENFLKGYARYINSYKAQLIKAQNMIEDSSAKNTVSFDGELSYISGYIPISDIERFKKKAKKENWAYVMDDVVSDDGEVPSKVNYTKVTRLMKPVFDILGTVPGYNEYDISFWFLCFFSIFVSMIIGDAAYGAIILILAIVLNIKMKKANDAVLLLYVLSISTIVWGAVTGTWFGTEKAMAIPFLKNLVIPGIANFPELFGVTTKITQNNVMKLCFTIGVIQLDLACIMNVRKKLKEKNLSLVSDIGWLIAISALYVLVLYLVIGEKANLMIIAGLILIGFILVVLFGGMSPELSFKEGLSNGLKDAFTTFLNTISAFGNVMSYIRLFAVGMASLAIAQSFNDMASNFSGVLIVVAAFIVIFGHALNIVMALLSVVVHAVRLNLLEYSGQLGMEWSGTEYDPFRKLDKVRK